MFRIVLDYLYVRLLNDFRSSLIHVAVVFYTIIQFMENLYVQIPYHTQMTVYELSVWNVFMYKLVGVRLF